MTASLSPVVPDPDGRPRADRGSVAAPADTSVSSASPEAWRVRALRTRNIGILCDDPQSSRAVALQRELSGLGARVALVRAGVDDGGNDGALEPVAYVLGRLYDAVVCVGLGPNLVRNLKDAAGIPVISGEAYAELEPGAAVPAAKLLNDLLTSLRA